MIHWGPREITLGHGVRHCVEHGGGTCTTSDIDTWLARYSLEPVTLTEQAFVTDLIATFTARKRPPSELDGYPVLVGEPEHQAVGQKIAAALTPRAAAVAHGFR